MDDRLRTIITQIYTEHHIDLFDIAAVKRHALQNKLYDVIVYINSNLAEYLAFSKTIQN